jgi:hypothetical protein
VGVGAGAVTLVDCAASAAGIETAAKATLTNKLMRRRIYSRFIPF